MFGASYTREQIKAVFECHIQDDYDGFIPLQEDFENGTFASTETLSCRLHKQATLDVTLTWLERAARRPAEAVS